MNKKRHIAMLALVVDSGITYQMVVGSAIAAWLLLARLVISLLQGLILLGQRYLPS